MAERITPDWIGLDWGTSNLRGWALQGGQVRDTVQSCAGMGGLSRDGFEPALADMVAHWDVTPQTPILACGMVGSRQGWAEAPYRAVPCTPLEGTGAVAPTSDRFNLRILPGLRQTTPSDVMRGEETQIAGFLALNTDWDGVICLPGTHTKWVQISAGEVISFQTYMTGEMFALLSSQSVLRHSVSGDGWDDATFDFAVEEALGKPEKLAARLFAIRADDLLDGTSPAVGRARLSGLLIGAELAASKPYWLGTNIAIIGADAAAKPYARALQTQGAPATVTDAERMTLAGLTAAYRQIQDTL
ncbi:2-dehydro-3-deoxygalactonokinase DgoK [Sulfitobacter noctilucicola]|uniref:2-dehydro-3-deoxygalactonokinase n=1 Tax=Sulfitobacter noctilucicola TaxID=1342301 RepID=A0A7W6Q776_9RHOB|nr:2-dehydro-3-deoxygalactonokinase [Sulfitobacter noctilucicola]KIN66231.1 2-dehydro-3-deoxygalactonokinase DgoK [Sulfitobacter noctilucicola]MBB4175585.1 2-dehydro-3-deoxygalactonokinase [Sulfitobacter noctilucicola]